MAASGRKSENKYLFLVDVFLRAWTSAVFAVSVGCPECIHLLCTQLYLLRLPDVDSAAFVKRRAVANTFGGQYSYVCGTTGSHIAYLVSLYRRVYPAAL